MVHVPRKQTASPPPIPNTGAPGFLWALIGVMAAVEILLSVSESGFLGATNWREKVLLCCAFWRPLLGSGVTPLYPGQDVWMFLSYSLVHGGFVHFAMNATILLALGKGIAARQGAAKTLLLFVLSAVSGAAGFALLATSSGPMIGASGAVFGFLGLWQAWDFRQRRRFDLPMRPLLGGVIGLIVVNVILNVALNGTLAWQAHLGGWLAGWIAAWIFVAPHELP